MICPADAIDRLLDSVEDGSLGSMESIHTAIRSIDKNYYTYEWSWAEEILSLFHGTQVCEFTSNEVVEVVGKWMKAVLEIDELLYNDAKKEFSLIKQTGFGIDGDEVVRKLDFEKVRGEFETHAEVRAIRDHMAKKESLGNEVIAEMVRLQMTQKILN